MTNEPVKWTWTVGTVKWTWTVGTVKWTWTVGTVKWFNVDKGYGFIHLESGEDAYVHFSDIQGMSGYRSLHPGQIVDFYVSHDDPNGPRAKLVRIRHTLD